jgi:ribose-phosphate pyrophosphokinase
MYDDPLILAGSAHPALAGEIVQALDCTPGGSSIERCPDGEISIRIEESVRGREIYLIQPTSPPVDFNLVELLAIVDACRRSGARRITTIIPYYGYARADRRSGGRLPIMASLVASMLEAAGVDQVVTVDVHTPQIEGFFHIPMDSLTAVPYLATALLPYVTRSTVVVAPDAGRAQMAAEYARRLGTGVVMLHKQRQSGTETRVVSIVGEVRDRRCILIDDMISTGGTLAGGIDALLEAGASTGVIVAATHGLFIDGALERLAERGVTDILVTDTVPRHNKPPSSLALHTVSIVPLLAEAIAQLQSGGSLARLR